MPASITAVRRKIHTGFPCHSTICRAPGASSLMSASTGAPAAFARSDGNMLPIKDVAGSRYRDAANNARCNAQETAFSGVHLRHVQYLIISVRRLRIYSCPCPVFLGVRRVDSRVADFNADQAVATRDARSDGLRRQCILKPFAVTTATRTQRADDPWRRFRSGDARPCRCARR